MNHLRLSLRDVGPAQGGVCDTLDESLAPLPPLPWVFDLASVPGPFQVGVCPSKQ